MKMQRQHAVLFLLLALWNVFTWGTFTKNLAAARRQGEHRPTGYWVAHTLLIVANLLIAGVFGRLGVQAWRATGTRHGALTR